MNIGIDIDDTLTYLLKIKIKTAKRYIKANKMNYQLVKKDTNLFKEMFDWPSGEEDKFYSLEADKMLMKVKPRFWAKYVIKKLTKEGHKIFIITGRTKKAHKDPYKLSYDWLTKNKIEYNELLVGYENKTQICLEKKIDIFVDDMPNIINDLNSAGIKTILLLNPHNHNKAIKPNCYKARNWLQIMRVISKLAY